MASNCSFRITRTTEDLAQTITALSQRLVKLEQRFEALELSQKQNPTELPVKEIEMLDGIDQQIQVCKALLDSSADEKPELINSSEDEQSELQTDIGEVLSNLEESESEQMWMEEEKPDELAA